jgi:hypothetical protein
MAGIDVVEDVIRLLGYALEIAC